LDFFRDFFHFFGGRAANQEFALVDDLPFHSQAPNPTFGVAGRTKRRFWNVRFGAHFGGRADVRETSRKRRF
jgi:hypothetical protein